MDTPGTTIEMCGGIHHQENFKSTLRICQIAGLGIRAVTAVGRLGRQRTSEGTPAAAMHAAVPHARHESRHALTEFLETQIPNAILAQTPLRTICRVQSSTVF